MPPAASHDKCLYSQATFSVKNQRILSDHALYFKLARSVLKIAPFEFANLNSTFNSTFMNLKNARLVLNAKCSEIVVFTSVIVCDEQNIVHLVRHTPCRLYLYAYK